MDDLKINVFNKFFIFKDIERNANINEIVKSCFSLPFLMTQQCLAGVKLSMSTVNCFHENVPF